MRETQIWPGWDTVRDIGSGGYGKVYEIRKTDSTGSYCSALKVISIPRSEDEYREYIDNGYDDKSITAIFKSQVDDIVSEFKMMSQFKGTSNIVSYEDHMIVPREGGQGWDILIRMELLMPLPEYINQYGLTEEQAVQMGIGICRALELCAQKGIIHRDIKPQNIFVNEFGDFKLGDFGIARSMDHTTKATKTGTYSYMAPEVYSGKPYGASVDIYSLGLVLYWVLNERRLPFQPLPPAVPTAAQSSEAQAKRLSGTVIPEPRHGNNALKASVLMACSFDATDRFANPKAFRQALDVCGYAHDNVILPPQFQSGAQKTNGPSKKAQDDTAGEWSMKFTPPSKEGEGHSQGESTKGTWDNSTSVRWESSDPTEDHYEQSSTVWTEQEAHFTGKEALKAEKKQRRSIRLWAIWLFCWTGSGFATLLDAFPNPSTREAVVILLSILIGIIPFFFKVRRILKESNHNPRVRKTLFTSIGVIAALFLMVFIGNFAEKQSKNDLNSRPDSSYSVESSANVEISYTKGELNGDVYRNEWAGLLFSLPEGFVNASEDYYTLYNGMDRVECGLYLISDSREQIIIFFEQLPYSQISENIYLDSAISNFAETAQGQDVSMITDGKDRQDFLIGTEKYTKAQLDLSYENSAQVAESLYVRKIDDMMCCVQIIGASGIDNDNLAQLLGWGSGDNQTTDGPGYTKGTFDGTTYVNEWANLKFVIPEGWEIDNDTSAIDSDTRQYGLSTYGDDAQGYFQMCNIYFERLEGESFSMTEEAYLDSQMDFIEKAFNIQPDRQYEKIQLGYTFTSAHVYGRLDLDYDTVESMYLCKLGDRMCIIEIVGESQEANDQLVSRFTKCH